MSERDDREKDDSGGFRFTLPPIRLPDVRFPERFRLFVLPPRRERPGPVEVSGAVLVAPVLDVLDGALVLAGVDPAWVVWLRVLVGTGYAVGLLGPLGAVYAWEGLAVLLGAGWLGVVPSATLLVLTHSLRKRFGRRHPEEVDGVAERER